MFTKFMSPTGDGGTGDGQQPKTGDGQQPKTGDGQQLKPVTFEAWYEKQDKDIQELLETHTKGLKSALDSERENRGKLEKQLRETAKKAEEGSELQTKLTKMADELAEADRKADFYDAAHKAGATNLRLAYLAAVDQGLIDSKGRVNFDEMKKSSPELFASPKGPTGNAGDGTDGDQLKSGFSMNDAIRKQAGRPG